MLPSSTPRLLNKVRLTTSFYDTASVVYWQARTCFGTVTNSAYGYPTRERCTRPHWRTSEKFRSYLQGIGILLDDYIYDSGQTSQYNI